MATKNPQDRQKGLNPAILADTEAEWARIGGGKRSVFDTNQNRDGSCLASNLTHYASSSLGWTSDDYVQVEVQMDLTTGRKRVVMEWAEPPEDE